MWAAYPDPVPSDATMGGYQLMIAGEILRGRFRRGFDRPVAFTPREVDEVTHADFVAQTHRVHFSRRHPARVTFATKKP